MLAYIKGTLIEKHPMRVVIDCNNIGYDVIIPLNTYETLGVAGSDVLIYVLLDVTADDMRLYGFSSVPEKELFKLIKSVGGVGAKTALSVLSTLNVETFANAILNDNDKVLTTVPGIGKKTAQRLILELKEKIENIQLYDSSYKTSYKVNSITQEAETALVTLGYKTFDIKQAIDAISKEENIESSELLIKKTIQYLYTDKHPKKKNG